MTRPSNTTQLAHELLTLHDKKFSGILKVTLLTHQAYYLIFKVGDLVLIDRQLPSPQVFLKLLKRYLKTGLTDVIIKYASKHSQGTSIRAMLDIIIQTRALGWEDVEHVVYHRMVVLLEQVLDCHCTLEFLSDLTFDISYGPDHHGFRYEQLLATVQKRQVEWKPYRSVLTSVHRIPYLHHEVFATVDHEPTRYHLSKWVNGQTSFADIAEGLSQDPLALMPLYYRWVTQGLITFGEHPKPPLPVILSVEDSPVVQTLIRKALSESYEVISVSSAFDAMVTLTKQDIALVLLEVTLPEINGLELCRTIRKISTLKRLPIILLTAKDGMVDKAKGYLAGANRYLTKPIDQTTLLATINELTSGFNPQNATSEGKS